MRWATRQAYLLTPEQSHDLEGADVLLNDTPGQTVIADKAYDAQTRVVEPSLGKGKGVVIPSRSAKKLSRKHNRHFYQVAPYDCKFLCTLEAVQGHCNAL